jgi:hypothetical protein
MKQTKRKKMKLIKMSLVAALFAGSSAFAVDNLKVSGDVNVFYHTQDAQTVPDLLAGEADGSLFSKDSSAADASLNLAISADVAKNDLVTVSANAGYTILTTLGLENNFVSNVWGGAHDATLGTGATYAGSSHDDAIGSLGGAKVDNPSYMTEAYVTLALQKATKTSVMIGRMPVDTPLVFTETWSIEKNTFEGAVLVNQDIPGTTVVGAYIGNGNGNESMGTGLANSDAGGTGLGLSTGNNLQGDAQSLGLAYGAVVNGGGEFGTFGTDGAYALGVVNNSFEPLTAQLWYYDVVRVGTAYWLQGDLKCKMIPGVLAGAQYTAMDLDSGAKPSTMAFMLGYDMKDVATVKFAYSQTDEEGSGAANVATGTGASKLYTETWWTYGKVTQADTSSMSLSVESPVNGLFDLGVYYTSADAEAANSDLSEITLTAGKEFGPLNATLAYINTDAEGSDKVNAIQAYLTLGF